MEEENQVFGRKAELLGNSEDLESEDFSFYHRNKEQAKNNIDSSSKELTDFISSLIKDVPDPSEDEVNSGIEKILERTHPQEAKNKTSKSSKSKKVTFRVLFIAALLSVVLFSCLCVVGKKQNISIENGFLTFAKETVKVVFFGEDEEESMTVDVLLTDLESHGYENILFAQKFVTRSDKYKVSLPKYIDDEFGKQVSFDIYNDSSSYLFNIIYYKNQQIVDYTNIENAKTFNVDGICVYVFDNNGIPTVEFTNNGYRYYIVCDVPCEDVLDLIETIK
ncbi:MAG: hypothetical protein IKJ27_05320 [Clostridia bacterium]|nr:hypothetical protein [Clostridia bacterium]